MLTIMFSINAKSKVKKKKKRKETWSLKQIKLYRINLYLFQYSSTVLLFYFIFHLFLLVGG